MADSMPTPLVMVMLAIVPIAACGAVRNPEPGDGTPTTYRGMLTEVPPMMFGGGAFCTYTITLRQVDIQITIDPSGQVTDAAAQNLNVENIVPPCPFEPQPPAIASYMFASTTMTPDGIVVALDSAPTTTPVVMLQLRLERSVDTYMANFEYRRTDQSPPLDWLVVGSLVLSPE